MKELPRVTLEPCLKIGYFTFVMTHFGRLTEVLLLSCKAKKCEMLHLFTQLIKSLQKLGLLGRDLVFKDFFHYRNKRSNSRPDSLELIIINLRLNRCSLLLFNFGLNR